MAILCISICLYPINVKTAEPIGPTFFVEPRVRRDPFMDDLISKIHDFFYKIREISFVLQCMQRENVHF